MKLSAILLCGGTGERMAASSPKQYLPLAGKPIALHSLELLLGNTWISEVIIVCENKYEMLFKSYCGSIRFAKPGVRRQDSVYNGLQKVDTQNDYVLIHDSARPLLLEEDLQAVIDDALIYGAVTLATPVKETIKESEQNQMVSKTLNRKNLFNIQTPQILKKEILKQGFDFVKKNNLTVTDDVSLAELISHPVRLVIGSYENIKITTPEDLNIAENILLNRHELLKAVQV